MKVYTSDEVAELMKVEPITVRRWLAAGKLSGFKAGKEWRITEEDVKAFIEANRPHKDGE